MPSLAAWVTQHEGSETGITAELFRGHLIDGDGVVKAPPGNAQPVGSGEPERAALMTVGGELVVAVLHDGDVFLKL